MPWEQIDLTVSGLQNAADPLEPSFSYLADVNVSTAVTEATVQIGLPEGSAYVPGTASVIPAGATAQQPLPETDILSIGSTVCLDPDTTTAGLPADGVVLTLTIPGGLPAGTSTISIDVRAGIELGPADAVACASTKAGTQVDTGSDSTTVDVVESDVPLPAENGAQVIAGDVVNLGYISGDEDVDIYSFEVTDAQANLGLQGDLFLSNIPEGADYDLTLFGATTDPLRGEPEDVVGFVEDVVLDLNPFDDRVQADPVQDIPQTLPATVPGNENFVPIGVQANRTGDEQIRTGTLRAGTYYVQVSTYNGELVEIAPYALRLRTTQSLTRDAACAPLPAPSAVATADFVDPALLDPDTNTLFLINTELFQDEYGELALTDVLGDIDAVAGRADLGVESTRRSRSTASTPCRPPTSTGPLPRASRCGRTTWCRRSVT